MSDRHISNSTVRAERRPPTPCAIASRHLSDVVVVVAKLIAVDVMIAHVFRCVAAEPVRDFGCVSLLRRQHEDN